MKAWNLKQLKSAMLRDLNDCTTDSERSMCRAMCGSEIRSAAINIAETRKLTPCEAALAREFGY